MKGRKYTASFAALLRLFWIDAACIVAEDVSRAVAVRAGVFGGAVAGRVASEEGDVAGEGFVQCCEGSAGKEEKQLHVFHGVVTCKQLLGWMDDN